MKKNPLNRTGYPYARTADEIIQQLNNWLGTPGKEITISMVESALYWLRILDLDSRNYHDAKKKERQRVTRILETMIGFQNYTESIRVPLQLALRCVENEEFEKAWIDNDPVLMKKFHITSHED